MKVNFAILRTALFFSISAFSRDSVARMILCMIALHTVTKYIVWCSRCLNSVPLIACRHSLHFVCDYKDEYFYVVSAELSDLCTVLA